MPAATNSAATATVQGEDTMLKCVIDRHLTAGLRFALVLAMIYLPAACARGANERSALLEAAIATVTVEELQGHVALLADDTLEGREAGSRGGKAAARYIESKLKAAGLAPAGDGGSYLQRFHPNYQNLIAKLPGVDASVQNECVLVGAHYDHVGYGTWRNSNGPVGYIHNGADDNASGVATLLELIDALTRTQWQPRRTIIFAFWDGEEIDLLGSRHWIRQPTVPLAQVKLAVNIDMIGRLRDGRLEVGGTRTAPGLRQLLSSSRLPEGLRLDFTWEYKENSDHWPLFEAGVPSLIVHTGLHGDYHTPRDDLEKVNVPGMRVGAAYLLEAACRLADAEALPAFRAASRGENPTVQKSREAPLPPLPGRLGITWRAGEQGEASITVTQVAAGSSAAAAGLLVGDKIVSIDGEPIEDQAQLPAAVLRTKKEMRIGIVRGGEEKEVDVALGGDPVELGISWREDDAEPGAVFVTRVVPYSPAARAGLVLGDRIYSMGGEPFDNSDALLKRVRKLLDERPERIEMEVESSGHVRVVSVDLRAPGASDDHSL